MAYYVISDDKCLFEGMTKEEILAAITQAVSTHTISDVDTGFVTTIKEKNKNAPLSFWVGTTAEYNALSPKTENTFYILTDDTDIDDLENAISEILIAIDNIDGTLQTMSGTIERTRDDLDATTGIATAANTMAETAASGVNKINDKNGQVLLNQTVQYGVSVNVDLIGLYPISEFTVVSVDGILCKIRPRVGGDDTVEIRGTGTTFTPLVENSTLKITDIYLVVSVTTNEIVSNYCEDITFTLAAGGAISTAQRAISKIVGVC